MIQTFIDQNKQTVARQFLGSIRKFEADGNNFYFSDINSCLMVSVISEHIIRVRLAPHGAFLPEFSYGLQGYNFKPCSIQFSENKKYFEIATESIKLRLEKENFKISFYDKNDWLINEDNQGLYWEENHDYGGYNVYCSKKIFENENFYALGDKASDLNLKGRYFSHWSTDAYAFERNTDPLYRNIPFYIGLHHGKAYGIFFDNTYRTTFNFGVDNPDVLTFSADGGEMNYYFIHGPHMMDVTKRFAQLTGNHPMPPMWALGYHQCRWSYYPESKVMELANTFRQKKIPCDAIYLDIDYMDGYRCFTWNKEYFPDPKRMISALEEQGFKTVVIIDPGIKVDNSYFVFQQGKEIGAFCRRGDDYYMEGPVWPGRCQFPDFTNPRVREWWGGLHKILLDDGVAGIWCDMNEPSVFGTGTFPNDVRHYYEGYRGSHRKAHNVYGMQMVRATYEGLRKLRPNKRPFTITRSAYAGTQRYAACWTGDNIATWDHLKLASQMCQRLSMSGFSFCGSDIGGFTGEPDGELFTRWIQLGVFTPLMRAHSAGDTIEREPWSFGEPYESICRKFIELRYKLLPYFYSAFWENHKYGFPILRPIVMVEQEAPNNFYRQDEFTFGDKILVCPIFEPGATGRWLYLPKGDWYFYWNNEKYTGGGDDFWIDTSLETMPIFIRAGAVIPEYPVMQYTGEFELKELVLNIYYADYLVNSFIYEDHGDTFAYEQEIYTEKKFVVEGNGRSLSIKQSAMGMFTPRYDTYRIKLIGVNFKFRYIRCDDKIITDYYVQETTGIIEFVVFKSFEKIEIS
jgi:alpha-glucosidase